MRGLSEGEAHPDTGTGSVRRGRSRLRRGRERRRAAGARARRRTSAGLGWMRFECLSVCASPRLQRAEAAAPSPSLRRTTRGESDCEPADSHSVDGVRRHGTTPCAVACCSARLLSTISAATAERSYSSSQLSTGELSTESTSGGGSLASSAASRASDIPEADDGGCRHVSLIRLPRHPQRSLHTHFHFSSSTSSRSEPVQHPPRRR